MRKVIIIVDLLNLFLTNSLIKSGYYDGINKDGKMECEFRLGIEGECSTFLPQEVVFEKRQLYMNDFTEAMIDDIQDNIDKRIARAKVDFNLEDSNGDVVEVVFAYDSVTDEFRKILYPEYKFRRKGLYVKNLIWGLYKNVLSDIMDYISSRYPIKYKPQYEADDIILSLVEHYNSKLKREALPAVDVNYKPEITADTITTNADVEIDGDIHKLVTIHKNYNKEENTYDVTEITVIMDGNTQTDKSVKRYKEFKGVYEYIGIYVDTDDKDAYITLKYDNVRIFKITQNQDDIDQGVLTYMDKEQLKINTELTPEEYEVFMILNGDTSDSVPALLDEVISKEMAMLFENKKNLEKAYKELKEFYDNNFDLSVMSANTDTLFRNIEDRNRAVDAMLEENKSLPENERYYNLNKFTVDAFYRNIKLISLVSFPITEIADYDPEIHGRR